MQRAPSATSPRSEERNRSKPPGARADWPSREEGGAVTNGRAESAHARSAAGSPRTQRDTPRVAKDLTGAPGARASKAEARSEKQPQPKEAARTSDCRSSAQRCQSPSRGTGGSGTHSDHTGKNSARDREPRNAVLPPSNSPAAGGSRPMPCDAGGSPEGEKRPVMHEGAEPSRP